MRLQNMECKLHCRQLILEEIRHEEIGSLTASVDLQLELVILSALRKGAEFGDLQVRKMPSLNLRNSKLGISW